MLTLRAPAKVNLFLRVLAREPSGYHQLETLFCSLEFADTLSFERTASGLHLEIDGPDLGPTEENLVYRAAKGFLEASGADGGVRIGLKKRIPVGGGLGGGSSDAGTTLQGLEALFPGALDRDRLSDISGELGSDVPFFLSQSSLALAWGRGDRLQPLSPLPPAPVLLAVPPMGMPTAEAYGLLARERQNSPDRRRPRKLTPEDLKYWDQLSRLAVNDFEGVVLGRFPLLAELRRAFLRTNALFSLLSGSGSSLFGIFPDDEAASAAKVALEAQFPETGFVLTRTEVRTPGYPHGAGG